MRRIVFFYSLCCIGSYDTQSSVIWRVKVHDKGLYMCMFSPSQLELDVTFSLLRTRVILKQRSRGPATENALFIESRLSDIFTSGIMGKSLSSLLRRDRGALLFDPLDLSPPGASIDPPRHGGLLPRVSLPDPSG